nr:hypothetical protein [Tanacetum cinerariifolium]
MVSVPIHQDTSSVPLMTTLVIVLMTSQSGSPLPTSAGTTSAVSKAVDEIITDAVDWAMQAPLEARLSDLPTIDIKEILQQRMFEDKSYESHEDHKKLYDALEKSLERDYSDQLLSNLEEARQKKRKRQHQDLLSYPHILLLYLLTTSNTRYESDGVSRTQELSPTDSLIQDDSIPDEQAYEVVKAFYPNVIHLEFQMEECHKMLTNQVDWMNRKGDQVRVDVKRPLPLGGPSGHVTIQTQFFFNKDLDAKYGISHWWFNRQKLYIDRHDSPTRQKEVRSYIRILSVVRIRAYSRYGYDYLSEIDLRRADLHEHTLTEKDFKNLYPSDFEDLNLLLLQGHFDYFFGFDKRKLSTAIKLWTQNLVIRQRFEDFQLGIKSYQTQLNHTKPTWDATCYEFKHDYTIIEFPRAVVFPVNNNEQKIMRFNEIHKFSDDTLTRILETLAYRVKEFKIKRLNP